MIKHGKSSKLVKVVPDYDYIYNVYDYIASGSGHYD